MFSFGNTKLNYLKSTSIRGVVDFDIIIPDSSGLDIASIPFTPFSYNLYKKGITCNGAEDGYVSITTNGGSGQFIFHWLDGDTSSTGYKRGFGPGNYYVIIEDVIDSLKDTVKFSFTDPLLLELNYTYKSIQPNSPGEIVINPTGGAAPYNYSWHPDRNSTTNQFTVNHAGFYEVVVFDSNQCMEHMSFYVADSSDPGAPLKVEIVKDSVNCANDSSAYVYAKVTGGTGIYSYAWNFGDSYYHYTYLYPGSSYIEVTDGDTTILDSFYIHTRSEIQVSYNESAVQDNRPGQIVLSPYGGKAPYQYYYWGDRVAGHSLIDTITFNTPGEYTIQVLDANGCSLYFTTEILSQVNPSFINLEDTAFVCAGESVYSCPQAIGLGVNLDYYWSDGITNQYRNLTEGVYYITASNDSISITDSIVVIATDPVFFEFNKLDVTDSTLGEASIFVHSINEYELNWYSHNDGMSLIGTDDTITSLVNGSYSYEIGFIFYDSLVCYNVTQFNIFNDSTVLNDPLVLDMPDTLLYCNRFAHLVTPTVTGGSGSYNFLWSDSSTQSSNNLAPGRYQLTVTDGVNTVTDSIVIVESTSKDFDVFVVDENQFGLGSIKVQVNWPYSYRIDEWRNGHGNYFGTEDSINVPKGIYFLNIDFFINDSSHCSRSKSVRVKYDSILSPLSIVLQDTILICNDDSSYVCPSVIGGSGNYSFFWSNGAVGQVQYLKQGMYWVTVSDGTNSVTDTVVVRNSSNIVYNLSIDSANNSAFVSVSGGSGNYNIGWRSGSYYTVIGSGDSISNLAPGNYHVEISDALVDSSYCRLGEDFQIIRNSTPLSINVNVLQPNTCSGWNDGVAEVVATGGSGNYYYLWSTGSSFDTANLTAGHHWVIVSDGLTSITDSFDITGYQAPQISFDVTHVSNTTDGEIQVQYIGSLNSFDYIWSTGDSTPLISNLDSGTYKLKLSDSNGCEHNYWVTVLDSSDPVYKAEVIYTKDASCFNDVTGEAVIKISGGYPPYTMRVKNYVKQVNGSYDTIRNLGAGIHFITVYDRYYIPQDVQIRIGQPPVMISTVSSTPVKLNQNGSASVNVVGGVSNYSYDWGTGDSTNQISTNQPGIYGVKVTDQNGCVLIDSIEIEDSIIYPTVACTQMVMRITFDNYPEENSYVIRDDQGNRVAGGGDYGRLADGSTITDTLCLPNGCYTLEFKDTYGDGMCCHYGNGSYELLDSNGIAIASGSRFGSIDVSNFCVAVAEPDPTYCSDSASDSSYEWIDTVRVGDHYNPSGRDHGYGDYTANKVKLYKTEITNVDLIAGKFFSSNLNAYWKVWIDYNHDGDFDDHNETVISINGTYSAVSSTSFIVPEKTRNGRTRMRIALQHNYEPFSCGLLATGEVEDYTVEIFNAREDSAGFVRKDEVGIDQIDNAKSIDLNIYPNPSRDENVSISYNLGEISDATIVVTDISGRITMNQIVNNTDQGIVELSAEQLAPSTYIVTIQTATSTISKRFVKL